MEGITLDYNDYLDDRAFVEQPDTSREIDNSAFPPTPAVSLAEPPSKTMPDPQSDAVPRIFEPLLTTDELEEGEVAESVHSEIEDRDAWFRRELASKLQWRSDSDDD